MERENHLLNIALDELKNKDCAVVKDLINARNISVFKLNDDGDFIAAQHLDIENAIFYIRAEGNR